ncbi:unnamed protein product [Nyctereutes procyonoides]|uniref:(raccoon dog) hypothetical protein n=1 Tax=Nyctereutes procyonoides TaxID=34880 RepID=A0A811Y4F1_NYCPR|nr:unnamed protein product [Nyctereutes procyonoides]
MKDLNVRQDSIKILEENSGNTLFELGHTLITPKLEQVFAKPFLGSLDGHQDEVNWKMNRPGYGKGGTNHCINIRKGKAVFAICGQQVDIWDKQRANPTYSMTWGFDSITSVKFNPIETFLLGNCTSNRNTIILEMRTNMICWNPMEALIFTAANEDYNLYTFDMYALNTPAVLHKDHVSTVLDVHYSPNRKEFEIYHTKRMQHVICVKWTSNSKYITCGSDEMNISAKDYNQKSKEKFQHHSHVKCLACHQFLSKSIYTRQRKEVNHLKHRKPGSVQIVSEKK